MMRCGEILMQCLRSCACNVHACIMRMVPTCMVPRLMLQGHAEPSCGGHALHGGSLLAQGCIQCMTNIEQQVSRRHPACPAMSRWRRSIWRSC